MKEHTFPLAERVRRMLLREAWNIGVIAQRADDIVRNGLTEDVRWFPTPRPGTMLADPSCFRRADGGYTLFAEFLDYRRPLGEIWSAALEPGADFTDARFSPLLQAGYHMSYPFPIEDEGGARFLTAESWQADAALLWSERDGQWTRAGTLFPGRQIVDPTLWKADDRWWLFCTFRDDQPDTRLHLFHAKRLGDEWIAHPLNPICAGAVGSRPAGPLFLCGDQLIRPAQDCSRTYGGAVVLNAVQRLDEHGYHETPVRRIEFTTGRYPGGPHTFTPAGEVTLVDGKHWEADPARMLRRTKNLARRMLASVPGLDSLQASSLGSPASKTHGRA